MKTNPVKTPLRVGITKVGTFKIHYNARCNRIVYHPNGSVKEIHLAHPNPRGGAIARLVRWVMGRKTHR